jgi:amidase
MVPGGFISGNPTAKDTPDYPLGVTFAGRAWSSAANFAPP